MDTQDLSAQAGKGQTKRLLDDRVISQLNDFVYAITECIGLSKIVTAYCLDCDSVDCQTPHGLAALVRSLENLSTQIEGSGLWRATLETARDVDKDTA